MGLLLTSLIITLLIHLNLKKKKGKDIMMVQKNGEIMMPLKYWNNFLENFREDINKF